MDPGRVLYPSPSFWRRMGGRCRPLSAPKAVGPTASGQALNIFFDFDGGRRVLAGHHFSTGLAFQFEPGTMGNPAAGLCGSLVGGQTHSRLSLRDLTRGKLGQGRKDELGRSDLLAGVSYA